MRHANFQTKHDVHSLMRLRRNEPMDDSESEGPGPSSSTPSTVRQQRMKPPSVHPRKQGLLWMASSAWKKSTQPKDELMSKDRRTVGLVKSTSIPCCVIRDFGSEKALDGLSLEKEHAAKRGIDVERVESWPI